MCGFGRGGRGRDSSLIYNSLPVAVVDVVVSVVVVSVVVGVGVFYGCSFQLFGCFV